MGFRWVRYELGVFLFGSNTGGVIRRLHVRSKSEHGTRVLPMVKPLRVYEEREGKKNIKERKNRKKGEREQ